MRAYAIVENRIMLRDHGGHLFWFAPALDGHEPALRLIAAPRWKGGVCPLDVGARVDVARGAARSIAREQGLIVGAKHSACA